MRLQRNKFTVAICFALIIAVSTCFIPLSDTVWAEEGDDDTPSKLDYLHMHQLQSGSTEEDSEEGEEEQGDPYETGIGVHADPAVFEENFDLTWEQKKETIQEIQKMAADNAKAGMSDLEKYYRLAIAANKRAEYDWNFWDGRYFFEYKNHQWDSYGVLYDKSVCAGIAIFYSHLCHAADLPCWFVRMNPKTLDHTISYIPDIHGKAYYVDVTEDMFLMSDKSNPFGDLDKDFSHITKDCTDYTFDYLVEDDEDYEDDEDDEDVSYSSSSIKDYYDTEFAEWFDDFAKHNNPEKKYPSEPYQYDVDDSNHVSYHDYRSNFVDTTDVWFLDDFYGEPGKEGGKTAADIKAKILNKEFDDQLVNVSGIKNNYDCDSKEALESIIAQDISANKISAEYFPTCQDGEVVAESATLTNDDYTITCTAFDLDANTAELTVEGQGDYSGSYQIEVKLNSAVVTEAPVPKKGLKYTGKPHDLIEEGVAEGGKMQYALGTKDGPTDDFTTAIPTATDAGKYYVWYKAVGTEDHKDSDAACVNPVASIAPITVNVIVENDMTIKVGEMATISPKLDNAKIQAKFKFTSENEDIATVDKKGAVTGVSGGVTYIYIEAVIDQNSPNYEVDEYNMVTVEVQEPIDISETKVRFAESSFTYNGKVQKPTIKTIKGWKLEVGTDYSFVIKNSKDEEVSSPKAAGTYKVVVTGEGKYTGSTDATYTIKKAANPMTLTAKTVNVKSKNLKKKAKSVKRSDAFTVSKAKGTRSYKLVSAKKGKKSFKKKFKVSTKTGSVTMKKGLKKGTYKVKVKVKAKGTANYKASKWQSVTFEVRVK